MQHTFLAIIFIYALTFQTQLLQAADKSTADKSIADKSATEIQALKSELSQAKVTSMNLKSGEVLAAAILPTKNDDPEVFLNVEFYYKSKQTDKWKFLDHLQIDNSSFEFRDDGVIKVMIEEGGSLSSKTTSLWRLEKDHLKVIGQDSEILNRSALNSKIAPYSTVTSTNFLTGKKTVTALYSPEKKKNFTCKFDKEAFVKQKISEINLSGAREPECPDTKALNDETRKLNGQWELTEITCSQKSGQTKNAKEFNKAIKNKKSSFELTLENGKATYKIKFNNPKDQSWNCSAHRTESWHLEDEELTVHDTHIEYLGPSIVKCSGHENFKESRQHQLAVSGEKMEIELTGNIPGESVAEFEFFCIGSVKKLIYKRLK